MIQVKSILLGLGLLASAGLAQAAPITLFGDRFSVTYDDTQTGLLGAGLLSGSLDTLYFQPTAFSVFSAGGAASVSTALQFTVAVDAGYILDGLGIRQWGNYFLSGGGSTGASANLQLVDAGTLAAAALALAPAGSLNAAGGTLGWEMAGFLAAPAGAGQVFQVNFDSTLVGNPANGIGFIQDNYAGFRIATRPAAVPEPSGLALLLAGSLAAFAIGARRVRQRN
jgi:hypothetical protein